MGPTKAKSSVESGQQVAAAASATSSKGQTRGGYDLGQLMEDMLNASRIRQANKRKEAVRSRDELVARALTDLDALKIQFEAQLGHLRQRHIAEVEQLLHQRDSASKGIQDCLEASNTLLQLQKTRHIKAHGMKAMKMKDEVVEIRDE